MDSSAIFWALGVLVCLLTLTTYLISRHPRKKFDQLEFLKRISEKDNVQEPEHPDKSNRDSAG